MSLHIAPDLDLPVEAVTQTFAILAKRGVGKTYTASVMAEEMVKAGLPVAIVDPIGVWWGLRSSADGKHAGLGVIVLGGEHGDAPLEKEGGQVVADFLIDERAPTVVDLSLLRKREQVTFMTDFAERLYHRNRQALHNIVDEADAFAPQRPQKGAERLLGAMEDLVRRGRARGLGVTLVTQRAAVLNKNVLTQVEVLVTMRMIAPQDLAAAKDWMDVFGETELRAELMGSLPSLPVGTAWFWSPGWLDLFGSFAVRRRETFDSSATPKVGERRIEPRAMADVDLASLSERMAETIERAKADDPKALRRRIQELEAAIADQPAPAPERVEIPILPVETTERIEAATTTVVASIADLRAVYDEVLDQLRATLAIPPPPTPPAARGIPKPRQPPKVDTDSELSKGADGLLATLARRHPMRVTRAQLATLAGRSIKSSSFVAQVSELKREGIADERDGLLELTDAGQTVGGVEDLEPQTAAEVLAHWRTALPDGPRKMLDALLEHPAGVDRDSLADAAGFSRTSSSVGAHLKILRDNGLAETYAGLVTPSELLTGGGR